MPTLTLVLGLTQLHAEASSLLAILPTAVAGAWRQRRVRQRPLASRRSCSDSRRSPASRRGVQIAEALPEHVLRRLFGVLMLGVAAQLAWRARRKPPYAS